MFPGEEKGIVTSPGHKFELHYHILLTDIQKFRVIQGKPERKTNLK